jgi:hypothetical protein
MVGTKALKGFIAVLFLVLSLSAHAKGKKTPDNLDSGDDDEKRTTSTRDAILWDVDSSDVDGGGGSSTFSDFGNTGDCSGFLDH